MVCDEVLLRVAHSTQVQWVRRVDDAPARLGRAATLQVLPGIDDLVRQLPFQPVDAHGTASEALVAKHRRDAGRQR